MAREEHDLDDRFDFRRPHEREIARLSRERDELREALKDAGRRLRGAGMLGVPGNDPVAAALATLDVPNPKEQT